MSYYYALGTNLSKSGPPLVVRFYANEPDKMNIIENEYIPAVRDMMDQLKNNIGEMKIYTFEEYPRKTASDKSTLLNDKFKSFLESSNLYDYDGVHVLVTDEVDSGIADAGDSEYWNAFNTSSPGRKAVVPARSSDYGINICIQEILHPYINSDNPDVESDIVEDDEHSLGSDINHGWLGRNGDRTPMATSYEEYESKGSCSDNGHQNGYTTTLTDCTEGALEDCWQNHK